MVDDDSSKLAQVAETVTYLFVGGLLVYLATSNGGGGGSGGSGGGGGLDGGGIVPTPGTIDPAGMIMDGMVMMTSHVDPTLFLTGLGLG